MYISNELQGTTVENNLNRMDDEKCYTCDEAVNIIGTGAYTRSLLAALSVSLLSMAVDMFGFSVVVTGCACHFQLDHTQRSLLLSAPFVGPIATSYAWGYLSDTKGRRWSLLVGLWGGFIFSAVSAFSTHWVMLAVLKIIGTSFSSSAQSATYAYLGESCPERARGAYTLLMTSALMLFILAYDVPAYFILNLSFSYDWGVMVFTPWRLLALVISVPLAISALMLHFFCESPKFLLNAGKEKLALEYLNIMWKKNGNSGIYPVTKVVLNENSSLKDQKEPMAESLFSQILPLFKPPLLRTTFQLFYLTAVVYSINSGLVMWMPVIVEAFAAGLHNPFVGSTSLCDIILDHQSNSTRNSNNATTCISSVDSRTLASAVAHGVMFATVTLLISRVGQRKLLMIFFLFLPLVCSIAAVYNEDSVLSLVLYLGILCTNFCMGFLSGYYVDLYPTSCRGMATCLGVMMSRASGLAGVHALAALVMTHCRLTFFAFAVFLLSGIVVAYFLPKDTKV